MHFTGGGGGGGGEHALMRTCQRKRCRLQSRALRSIRSLQGTHQTTSSPPDLASAGSAGQPGHRHASAPEVARHSLRPLLWSSLNDVRVPLHLPGFPTKFEIDATRRGGGGCLLASGNGDGLHAVSPAILVLLKLHLHQHLRNPEHEQPLRCMGMARTSPYACSVT